MKNFNFLIAIVVSVAININLKAQEINNFNERGFQLMSNSLNLSPEQVTKAKEIQSKYKPEIDKISNEIKPYREKMKAIREKKIMEFESTLTQEQKNKLQVIKKNNKEKGNKQD